MNEIADPQEDALFFVEDDKPVPEGELLAVSNPWNILIIDDDPDVHSATMFALQGLRIQGRSLNFLHAYSTAEARQVLLHSKRIAVILLDVVMDDDNAGLQLVSYIRNTLELKDVRIILRTGQAGYAPEMDAIRDYDINDYKNKTELTQAKLYTTVTSAVRSYEQICAISASRRGLELIIKASAQLMGLKDLRRFSETIIEYVVELADNDGECFVCTPHPIQEEFAHANEIITGLRVVAGSLQYQDWLERPLVLVADKATQKIVQKALFERRNVFEADATALYFSNIGGASLAMYLDFALPPDLVDRHLLDMFCSNVSVCLDNVVLTSRMHNLAFFDPLTGLANRLHLLQTLHDTLHTEKKADSALALVDIDHFAETNDALGHQFGDFLLCSVGKRLRNYFGDNCQIARIGNDIFAILGHEDLVSPSLILSLFEQPFVADHQNVQLSATLGLIKFSEYELSGSEALKDANIALKRAKSHNRSGYSYFTRDMGVEIRERVRMMHALRAAFEGERLFVVYQPQVDMMTGRTVGAEALLRWRTEDGQFIPPDQFIPIAEYSGLIVNIGEWVLRSACFELMQLRENGFEDFQIAVNVSQAQFSHPQFMQSLERALRDSRIPPHCLELEITESMAMTDPEMLCSMLQKIKSMGVRISIDDFGTGFSSLSQLQKLNVDKLKIDRAFVSEIFSNHSEASIAKMIVQLSQSLNLAVIAEGVETKEQADALLSFGCKYAQGFYFAKPQTKSDLRKYLRA
ncbi:EAL domain-containing protein [Undibacterium cyanobacteriorum]|uniref:EAL domain-containing protein n=1 Tax=Undibacterium cyanobacteriorum TaxID=3073561 RepID=A0ABY9RMQ0_9BURK|nr:EAL domain-containing protein [Undibacterium sp. 20NA77.5]WMW82478.1 EAL domain-containing protein [Undibacterium sp. 20NA77.5]